MLPELLPRSLVIACCTSEQSPFSQETLKDLAMSPGPIGNIDRDYFATEMLRHYMTHRRRLQVDRVMHD